MNKRLKLDGYQLFDVDIKGNLVYIYDKTRNEMNLIGMSKDYFDSLLLRHPDYMFIKSSDSLYLAKPKMMKD